MPYTIWAHFDAFRANIEPPPYAREAANGRVAGIIGHLRGTFDVLDSFQTGSVPRYTAVRGHSDLDLFAVLHFGKHCKDKTPRQVLQSVRNRLGSYSTPSRVRKDGQAITLSYTSWPNVDVVPVYKTISGETILHYDIADSISNEWIESKPRLHDKNMSKANIGGGQFKHVIKMIKWWNHRHGSVMRSHHIEVVGLRAFQHAGKFDNDYSWGVLRWFNKANELIKAGYLWHENSMVDEYMTYAQREDLKAKLARAELLARTAWHKTYNTNDDIRGAVARWQQLFGADKFPAYG